MWLIYAMIILGSALMVVNIYGFIRFVRDVQKKAEWGREKIYLYIPIVLLVFFLFGYIFVGVFGEPDLMMAGILFGGSVFVFIMYRMLKRITSKVIENEKLEAKLQAVEQSNYAKTRFLASISHEMRTPMNVILGMDRMALSNPELSEETRLQLENIGNSAEYLLGLINNMLDLNQIETGELQAKEERFCLKKVLDQIGTMARTACDTKGLTLETEYGCTEIEYFLGDNVRLKQILFSVVDNAIKYTAAPGTVTCTAENIGSTDGISTFRFVISDTGIGIDPEFLPRIFDTFSQEDSSSTNSYGGSGLGLSVAKSMTNLIGGTIEAESEKGKGTTVTITVPLKEDSKGTEKNEWNLSLQERRILIVEDIEMNAEIVADLLDLEGAICEHAENGMVAVEMVGRSPENYYDAILMDLRMPIMDGFEAARQIRNLDRSDVKRMPIIALTANAFAEDVKNSLEAGMNAHLAKPAGAEDLYDELKKQISLSQEI